MVLEALQLATTNHGQPCLPAESDRVVIAQDDIRRAITSQGLRMAAPDWTRTVHAPIRPGSDPLRSRAGTLTRTDRLSSGGRPGGTRPGQRNHRAARTCRF